ncbi:MAG: response regulator transcription factor [Clostridiales bacterium]|nr:response regulator transcription factor [Clostridiales bacterium]
MIRVLVVEDDLNIARMISTALSIGGYEGVVCDNGAFAVRRIQEEHFDLVLLDVMLPGLDGFSVMERIQNREVPVIFLTAMQNVADKVKGLRLGAEDYMVKPFEVVELLARIEVVLRRSNREHNHFCYRDITVDTQEHSVKMGRETVNLTPKEFDLLVFFLQNLDIALTRERLLSAVWGYDFAGETRTVDIHVRQLRKKLNLEQNLVTIPKLGYRLEK